MKTLKRSKENIDKNVLKGKGKARNMSCPCGSGLKFKKCHLFQYQDFIEAMKYKGSNLLSSGLSSDIKVEVYVNGKKSKKQSGNLRKEVLNNIKKMLKDKIANYSYFQDYENLKKAYKEYRKVLKDMGEEYLYKGKIGLPCITIEDRDTYNVDEYGYKIFVKTETKIVKVCEF